MGFLQLIGQLGFPLNPGMTERQRKRGEDELNKMIEANEMNWAEIAKGRIEEAKEGDF